MTGDLRELYQEVILDHNKRPRNFGELPEANRHAEGFNPLCGDHIDVYVQLEDGVIRDVRFRGSGCAISKASASLMTVSVKGKRADEAEELFATFHKMVTAAPDGPAGEEGLGRLTVFAGVREFPVRVKCATLPWHTLHAALATPEQTVSTEDPSLT